MDAFKRALEDEYIRGRGPMVGEFFSRYARELSPAQQRWCQQQEDAVRRNPRSVYNL
jgi:hypothetical protein